MSLEWEKNELQFCRFRIRREVFLVNEQYEVICFLFQLFKTSIEQICFWSSYQKTLQTYRKWPSICAVELISLDLAYIAS